MYDIAKRQISLIAWFGRCGVIVFPGQQQPDVLDFADRSSSFAGKTIISTAKSFLVLKVIGGLRNIRFGSRDENQRHTTDRH
ncbi:hypothetical protein [Paenibacillus elgii]|uniref:hypothetical protein n=1 Tax=Paenibacillus elgii TaxID=189691 RepID=UPI0030D746FB